MIQEYCRIQVSSSLWIALPVGYTEEFIQLKPQDISPIPAVHSCLLGLTNQQGRLLWILNLEKFLGIKPTPLAKQISAIAIRAYIPNVGICRLAFTVMALEEIITIDSQKISPVPAQLPARAKALLSGFVNINKKTYGILNINEIFRLLNPSIASENGTTDAVITELVDISTA